jgi:hypothetical protein
MLTTFPILPYFNSSVDTQNFFTYSPLVKKQCLIKQGILDLFSQKNVHSRN